MPSSVMKKCSWRVAGLAEACKQSLLRNRVLNEVDVSIEMEPKWVGPDLSHGYDGRQVSFLAATDQCHGGAARDDSARAIRRLSARRASVS